MRVTSTIFPTAIADGGAGLLAISCRGYGGRGAKTFLEGLGNIRLKSFAALAANELPAIAQAR